MDSGLKLRIDYLSKVRNRVIEPLWDTTHEFFDYTLHPIENYKIVFLNDIYVTENDILNLLDTNDGDFDQACGIDFVGESFVKFYD